MDNNWMKIFEVEVVCGTVAGLVGYVELLVAM